MVSKPIEIPPGQVSGVRRAPGGANLQGHADASKFESSRPAQMQQIRAVDARMADNIAAHEDSASARLMEASQVLGEKIEEKKLFKKLPEGLKPLTQRFTLFTKPNGLLANHNVKAKEIFARKSETYGCILPSSQNEVQGQGFQDSKSIRELHAFLGGLNSEDLKATVHLRDDSGAENKITLEQLRLLLEYRIAHENAEAKKVAAPVVSEPVKAPEPEEEEEPIVIDVDSEDVPEVVRPPEVEKGSIPEQEFKKRIEAIKKARRRLKVNLFNRESKIPDKFVALGRTIENLKSSINQLVTRVGEVSTWRIVEWFREWQNPKRKQDKESLAEKGNQLEKALVEREQIKAMSPEAQKAAEAGENIRRHIVFASEIEPFLKAELPKFKTGLNASALSRIISREILNMYQNPKEYGEGGKRLIAEQGEKYNFPVFDKKNEFVSTEEIILPVGVWAKKSSDGKSTEIELIGDKIGEGGFKQVFQSRVLKIDTGSVVSAQNPFYKDKTKTRAAHAKQLTENVMVSVSSNEVSAVQKGISKFKQAFGKDVLNDPDFRVQRPLELTDRFYARGLEARDTLYAGDLGDLFIRMNPEQQKQNLSDVAKTLKKMHSLGWVHGDIKGLNILVSRGKDPRSFVADFDSLSQRGIEPRIWTMGYCDSHRLAGQYTRLTDIYALAQTVGDLYDWPSMIPKKLRHSIEALERANEDNARALARKPLDHGRILRNQKAFDDFMDLLVSGDY